MNETLTKKIDFIKEIEKLKTIYRKNRVLNEDRFENSAEHSWHIALMAILFADEIEHKNFDIFKVVKMLLIHDIVEIYAGDTWLYDDKARDEAKEKEELSAEKIFGILPEPQKTEFLNLWHEFENRSTIEAKYAAALDGLQPIINHSLTGKEQLKTISKEKIIEKKIYIQEISPTLWDIALEYINICDKKGLYK